MQNNDEKNLIELPDNILSQSTKSFVARCDNIETAFNTKLTASQVRDMRDCFIDEIFPSALCKSFQSHPEEITKRCILCSTNESVNNINHSITQKMNVQHNELYNFVAINTIQCDNDEKKQEYTQEFLDSLHFSGLPPTTLTIAIGFPIILLRNFDRTKGLMNGTRLVVTRVGRFTIEAEIAFGAKKGTKVILPKLKLIQNDRSIIPFDYSRTQFPINLCFAMTVNKSQGQTLPLVGVDLLESHTFSHGQLYVALSRVKHPSHIKILSKTCYVRNVVMKEVLSNN
jgi:ATP-dependent DNA helicase PIF1